MVAITTWVVVRERETRTTGRVPGGHQGQDLVSSLWHNLWSMRLSWRAQIAGLHPKMTGFSRSGMKPMNLYIYQAPR